MAHLKPADYDVLEQIRGREVVVVPLALRVRSGREIIEARHPTTGHPLTFSMQDVDGFEVVTW